MVQAALEYAAAVVDEEQVVAYGWASKKNEKTEQALDRLMIAMPPKLWQNRLIIIDNKKIRSRSLHPRI